MYEHIIELIIQYKYAIIILITMPEGPVIMMISGALVKLGHLDLWPAYFSLFFGDLFADIIWYCLGYFGGRKFVNKFGKYFGVTPDKVEIVSRFYHKYHTWILFITKLTMAFGLAMAVYIVAGIVRIPFKRYIAVVGVGQLLWTGLLMFLGYTFINLYILIDDIMGKITFLVLAGVAVALAYRFMKTMNKKIEDGAIK